MKEKKVRYPKEGAFGEIDLSDGRKSYGRIFADLLIGFYAPRFDKPTPIAEIEMQEIALNSG